MILGKAKKQYKRNYDRDAHEFVAVPVDKYGMMLSHNSAMIDPYEHLTNNKDGSANQYSYMMPPMKDVDKVYGIYQNAPYLSYKDYRYVILKLTYINIGII